MASSSSRRQAAPEQGTQFLGFLSGTHPISPQKP